MSSTHHESYGDYYVTIQHCEYAECDKYLGVNYPSDYCEEHRPILLEGLTASTGVGQS